MRLASTCQCGAGREYLTATDSCYKCGSRWPKAGAARQPQGQSTRRAILAGAAGAAAATGAAAPPPPETDAPMPSETDAPEPETGPIVRRPSQYETALKAGAGIEIRFNARARRIETRKDDGPWSDLNDRRAAWIQSEITPQIARAPMPKGATKALILGRDRWDSWINAIAGQHEIDPFAEWLDGLPQWDGTERLDSQLGSLFGAKGKLARWAARYPFIGAIQRAYQPGCKLDEMPVLIGPQGCGKSAWCAGLLPPEHRAAWFSDSLALNDGPKTQVESTAGRVLVEVSELTGATKADIQRLKAYLTRQDDGAVRLAYRRNPESSPRRFVFVATANPDGHGVLPPDPTGNRRFVPVTLRHGDNVEAFLKPVRDQLWAEALAAYQSGRRANLPRDLMQRAAQAARDATYRDLVLEDRVAEIEAEESGRAREGIKLMDLADDCGLIASKPDGSPYLSRRRQRRLANVLKGRGWNPRKITKPGVNTYRAWRFER